MARVRISTTVDGDRLAALRRLTDLPQSKLIDQALDALRREIEAEREAAALDTQPYEADPDLSWDVPPGPHLPYDGDVPADVVAIAERRRQGRA